MNVQHETITITWNLADGNQVTISRSGDLPTAILDWALDQVKRQIGTYEPTPLDLFLEQNTVHREHQRLVPG